ncbi:MAG: NADH dehydrogenase [Lawsonibacter sp.]|nr:NADH dehydrogenase [Lawsonibacter sp.]
MKWLLPVLVFLPMACGPVSYLIGRRWKEGRDGFVLGVTGVELALVLVLLLSPELTFVWEDFCGLGIGFVSGGLHTVLALLAASGWLAATLLSREYFAHVKHRNRYYLFWLFTLGATVGVFLSADLYTTFLFFEVMSFTSYVAVVQTEESEALTAGGTYLAVAVIGGLVTLSGLFLLYRQLGTLQLSEMARAAASAEDKRLLWIGGLLALVGFGAKAGAFPLHIWLPTAHPAAPAPASAVLSGVITKTGVYGVSVLSVTLFLHNGAWGTMLAVLGAVTMVLGAVLAVCSVDLKRTLACSSVSQIGFILVGLSMQCLLGHHNAFAVTGTILHIVNHSLIKMVLFPAAGVIHLSTHSFHLNDIRGFGRGKPLLALVMGIPMLSLAGLPLLNGYVSKTLLHESIVEYAALAGAGVQLVILLEWLFLFSGGLTFAYMLKLFFCIFVEQNILPDKVTRKKWRREGGYIAPVSAGVLLVYAVGMPLLGALPNRMMEPIAAFARPFFHGEAPAHAVAYFSSVNLKGAAISLFIGALVYLLGVRPLLTVPGRAGRREYFDPILGWCNLEYRLYRPALDFLAKTLLIWAVFLDKIGFRLLFRGLPAVFHRMCRWLSDQRGRLVYLLTGEPYIPRPSLEQAVTDQHFGLYADHPHVERGVMHSFAFSLLLTGLGLAFAILFIFLRL